MSVICGVTGGGGYTCGYVSPPVDFWSNTVQTATFNTYVGGTCASTCGPGTPPGGCTGNDWRVSSTPCATGCPPQVTCSQLNPATCPVFNGVMFQQWNYLFQNTNNVFCGYPVDAFQTTDDIQRYLNTFGPDANFNNFIMPSWCGELVSTCPGASGAAGATVCPRLISTGTDGKYCQAWYLDRPLAGGATIVSEFCGATASSYCQCYAASVSGSSAIAALNPNNGAPLGCWYTLCSNVAQQLVPLEALPLNCPAGTCGKVEANFKKVSPATYAQTTFCAPPGAPSIWVWFFIALAVVAVIVLILVILFAYA